MRLGWICKNIDIMGDKEYVILFEEPADWEYDEVTPIAYAVLEEGELP